MYKFRDHYFENHSINDAINRNNDTKKELDVVLENFKEYERKYCDANFVGHSKIIILEAELKLCSAKYYYLKGRALNVAPRYSKEAEDLLSKAIKLDPKLVEAWNELGESYWKDNKITEAVNCFKGALKQVRTLALTYFTGYLFRVFVEQKQSFFKKSLNAVQTGSNKNERRESKEYKKWIAIRKRSRGFG